MPQSSLTVQTMERLVFIRTLFRQGVEQSHLPGPLARSSVLTLHDTAELFLILAADHLGASPSPQIAFMDYWPLLDPKKLAGGVTLSGKSSMNRVNRVRNDFKHHGIMPSPSTIVQTRERVDTFLDDNTPIAFGIAFDSIDMADLIHQQGERDLVKKATAAWNGQDPIEAMGLLVDALKGLLHVTVAPHYDERPVLGSADTFAEIRPMQQNAIAGVLEGGTDRNPVSGWDIQGLAEQIEKVTATTLSTRTAVRLLVLGIDYRKYLRFTMLTPTVIHYMNGRMERRTSPDYAPSDDEFHYCREFVIDVAIHLAEMEAHTLPPTWRTNGP